MIPLTRLWRWWTDTWRTPARARFLYGVMAVAFAVLTLVAALQGDALVAVLGALGAFVTIMLSVFAPRLAKTTGFPLREQGEPWKTN
jgi:hypothetical protein